MKTYFFYFFVNFKNYFMSNAAKIRDNGSEDSFASNSKNNASNLPRLSNKRYSVLTKECTSFYFYTLCDFVISGSKHLHINLTDQKLKLFSLKMHTLNTISFTVIKSVGSKNSQVCFVSTISRHHSINTTTIGIKQIKTDNLLKRPKTHDLTSISRHHSINTTTIGIRQTKTENLFKRPKTHDLTSISCMIRIMIRNYNEAKKLHPHQHYHRGSFNPGTPAIFQF